MACAIISMPGILAQRGSPSAKPAPPTFKPLVTFEAVGILPAATGNLMPSTMRSTVQASATPVVSPMEAKVAVPAVVEYVNVRSGPGIGFDVLGKLTSGQSAIVSGKSADGQWWQITFNDRNGWVYVSLVTFDGDPSAVRIITGS